MEEQTIKGFEYIPSTHDSKISMLFATPQGLNGGSESESQDDGGVRFKNYWGFGVPSTTYTNV